MKIECYGICFNVKAFNFTDYQNFKCFYQYQYPFNTMKGIKRDRALENTWEKIIKAKDSGLKEVEASENETKKTNKKK